MYVEYDSFLECYVLVINDEAVYLNAENHQDAVIEAKTLVGDMFGLRKLKPEQAKEVLIVGEYA